MCLGQSLAGILVQTLWLQSYEQQLCRWFNRVCNSLVITYYKLQKWQITWAHGRAQKYCSVWGYQINTQFDFSISQYIVFHWPERQLQVAICIKSSPSHSRLERAHLSPANELLPSVKLQLLIFVLLKSKLQGSYGRLSAASRYPALPPWRWAEGCCFVTGCVSGLWQGAYTEQPWPCMNRPGREGNSFTDLLETWDSPAHDESLRNSSCIMLLQESDLLIAWSLNKFRLLVCVCTP